MEEQPAFLTLHHCVQVLECEQPTLEEKIRRKYKDDKTVYIHVYLRIFMFLLNRQQV